MTKEIVLEVFSQPSTLMEAFYLSMLCSIKKHVTDDVREADFTLLSTEDLVDDL